MVEDNFKEKSSGDGLQPLFKSNTLSLSSLPKQPYSQTNNLQSKKQNPLTRSKARQPRYPTPCLENTIDNAFLTQEDREPARDNNKRLAKQCGLKMALLSEIEGQN
jgi:hypothetical protein